jgi:hypothetical protein
MPTPTPIAPASSGEVLAGTKQLSCVMILPERIVPVGFLYPTDADGCRHGQKNVRNRGKAI